MAKAPRGQTTILPVGNLMEVILWAVVGGVALTGSILSKRKNKLGGVILLVCSVVIIPAVNNAGNWGLFGLPYLIAGILLLNSRRLEK